MSAAAGTAVITALLPVLRRFARKLAGSAAEGDDLLQESCERMLKYLRRTPEAEIGRAWCYAVVRNCWVDLHRRRSRHAAFTRPLAEDEDIDSLHTINAPDLHFDDIWRHVDRLPPIHRETILLCCIEDLSSEEAAAVLDVPAGTVRSRLARAKLALADAIGVEVSHG
ncbi:RNA polymerase sigma factor [Zavarzinia aquatilis]|uniref:RNA polymerase subunit sigma-70 n=1 Tax=Zavarzinia aquatilis TaxID=2211142 RepID=A0A317DVR5_9PROT|nr:RNA polymerase sigma factor [Zavarzinia aquatilis]PWR18631.1 RNA polymerase subunit sigma-70 [Zavarzinia aquatilis]